MKIKIYIVYFLLFILASSIPAEQQLPSESALFNYIPRVALLIKEQYVEKERIDPDAMLASIFVALEGKIPNLVVHLPKSLEEKSKVNDELSDNIVIKKDPLEKNQDEPAIKEEILLEMGTAKKRFDFEKGRSLWGMIFLLRDIFKFIETEGNKQGLSKGNIDKEPIDWEKIEFATINAMLSNLDPHSIFLEPKYARDLTLTTKGEFGGVGIVISIKDGFLTVIAPMDDTPAFKAGIKAKDKIIKINDLSAINMDLNDAVSLLRGEPNTKVRITVQRDKNILDFELKRAIIKVESVAFALLDDKVGYLRIKAFQGKTAADVKASILEMKKRSKNKMNALILDLAGNPGGLLKEAVEVSDLFLDAGEIVSTKGPVKESQQIESASKGQIDPNLKMAVLLNEGSASASEIVAGALKYNDRAIVIGRRSFGKGSVQMLFDFPGLVRDKAQAADKNKATLVEPAALKLTIAQYFAPKEKTIQTIGVSPDIELSEVNVQKKEELSLFIHPAMREADLTTHLLGKKKEEEKPSYLISYLNPKADENESEYGKLDANKLNKDFSVMVAADILRNSPSPNRQDAIKNSEQIVKKLTKQQEELIANALKKFDINWVKGDNKASPKDLVVQISKNKPVIAGDKLHIAVKIKNISSKPLYQVHAITHSKTPLFDHREFLFGRIDPQVEIEREIVLDIPKDVISRKDLLTLEVRDIAEQKLQEMPISIEIVGLKRPVFSYVAFIDNNEIKPGELINLVIWIKNIGEGKALEPTVLLKSELANKIFIEKGRAQGGELLPNQEMALRLSFKSQEILKEAIFEFQIFDAQMHDLWQDKISFVFEPGFKKPSSQILTPKEKTIELFNSPESRGKVIATIKEDARFLAVKEIGDYFLIKFNDNLFGYVKKSEVTKTTQSITKDPIEQKLVVLNYSKSLPKILLSFGDGSGMSKNSSGIINAKIIGAENTKEILLYVNGKKVLYRGLDKPKNEENINFTATLKPGINVISVLAKVNASLGQRENITVFYDDKNQMVFPTKILSK